MQGTVLRCGNEKQKIDGQWQSVPTYVVNDKMPYGHGEKSVYLIKSFMGLTTDEAMAIRWHMGFSDVEFKGGGYNVSNAFNMYPLAVLAHVADLQATFWMKWRSKNEEVHIES